MHLSSHERADEVTDPSRKCARNYLEDQPTSTSTCRPLVPPERGEVPKRYGRILNSWQDVWREYLDHFGLRVINVPNSSGENHPLLCSTSMDLPTAISYFNSQHAVSLKTSSLLDLPPRRLTSRPKSILTRFHLQDFGLGKFEQKAAWFWSWTVA